MNKEILVPLFGVVRRVGRRLPRDGWSTAGQQLNVLAVIGGNT
jgi:hypothetical protein